MERTKAITITATDAILLLQLLSDFLSQTASSQDRPAFVDYARLDAAQRLKHDMSAALQELTEPWIGQ